MLVSGRPRLLSVAPCLSLLLALAACTPTSEVSTAPDAGADAEQLPTIAEFTAGMERVEGFLPIYQDAARARIYARLPASARERDGFQALYYSGLTTGHGANPLGLDRAELGDVHVVSFNPAGERVHVEAINYRFRAESTDAAERLAAERAFPRSVLAALPRVAESDAGESLVDLTDFIVRDAQGLGAYFNQRKEGSFKLDADRGTALPDATLNFPDNTELEGLITLTADRPGRWAASTAPDGGALTFRQHHSFVRLPDDGYTPRRASARMGHFSRDHLDFSVPIEAPLEQRLAVRHRLSPDEPLVYYVDSGAPEPIRSALIEGASWWSEGFAAAGFPGGFEVRVLPEDAHPLDVRYNVINWVHRSTRGWSYGASVVDPRTGEILKGHVTLGSQRIRQDRRIFEALLGSTQSGKGGNEDPVELSLARLRQLAAHEVGHTLGFEHNFAASTYGRASVMDYPAPLITMKDGKPQFDAAYAVGLGSWDALAFEYLYREWPDAAAEGRGLAALIERADAEDFVHLSDDETHAAGASHPDANVWDNGSDSVAALQEVLAVRAWGLEHFDATRVPRDADPRALELTFGPLYFMHRYQMAAVAKRLGGERFDLGSDATRHVEALAPVEQRAALEALLACLKSEVLRVPSATASLLKPTPGYHIDELQSWSGPNFDPMANAAAAADLALDALLDPSRAHRMNLHHDARSDSPAFSELLDALVGHAANPPRGDEAAAALHGLTQVRIAAKLTSLAESSSASPRVRAQSRAAIEDLARALEHQRKSPIARAMADQLARWLARPYEARPALPAAPEPPPGSPIGSARACGFE